MIGSGKMIAVQTNNNLYIVEMEMSEFLTNVAQNGLNASAIQAKQRFSVAQNDWMHLASSIVPQITHHICQVGEQFFIDTKPITTTKDLEFYMAPDGRQYSCEASYLLEMGKGKIVSPVVSEQTHEIPNPEIRTEVVSPVVPDQAAIETQESGSDTPDGIDEIVDEEAIIPVGEPKEEVVEESPVEEELEEEIVEEMIPISQEQRRAAAALDNIARQFASITRLPERVFQGVKNYVEQNRNVFRGYAEEYLASQDFREPRANLQTEFPVSNAFGQSQDMIDSLCVFPVFSRILSKKDFTQKFSPSDLTNATFVRVCPIGILDGNVQALTQKITISSEVSRKINVKVRNRLDREGVQIRKLTPLEKYEYYEEELEKYLQQRGTFSESPDTSITMDLGSYIDKLATTLSVPAIGEWESYDVLPYDTRVNEDNNLPTPLSVQLGEIAKTGRIATPVVSAIPLEEVLPSDEPEDVFEEPLEASIPVQEEIIEVGSPVPAVDSISEEVAAYDLPDDFEDIPLSSETVEEGIIIPAEDSPTERVVIEVTQPKRGRIPFLPGQMPIPPARMGIKQRQAQPVAPVSPVTPVEPVGGDSKIVEDGMVFDSYEQYKIYKMLTDPTFLAQEEQLGANEEENGKRR